MQSQIIALLIPAGCAQAALLVRRGDGQFALQGIDARVASAARVASNCFRRASPIVDTHSRAVVGYGVTEVSSA